jgi:CheY-like chemotaxis protein
VAKRNLLLVDADPRSLRVLEVSLRKAGYSVTTSADVDGALELIELTEPDMILADTRLPGKDGFAFVAALKARKWNDIPLVFLSSDPSVESRVRGLELGVEDYLTKPVYIREILTRVNLVMQRKEREGLSRTSKTRFAGALADMGLVDLLQTIDVSRKSGVLLLTSHGKTGSVFFQEGRVIDAELGDLSGAAAIYRFLLWNEGEFELDFRDVRREDKLGISTQGLLMEGMRRLDEWSRLQEQLPPMGTVLDVSHAELAHRLAEIPDEINEVLRLFDGRRTLSQVLDESRGDDLANLNAINKLYFEGFLIVRESPAPVEDPELNGDLLIGALDGPYIPEDAEVLPAAEPEPQPQPQLDAVEAPPAELASIAEVQAQEAASAPIELPAALAAQVEPALAAAEPVGVQESEIRPTARESGESSSAEAAALPVLEEPSREANVMLAAVKLKRVSVALDASTGARRTSLSGAAFESVRNEARQYDPRNASEAPPSAHVERDMAEPAQEREAKQETQAASPPADNVIQFAAARDELAEAALDNATTLPPGPPKPGKKGRRKQRRVQAARVQPSVPAAKPTPALAPPPPPPPAAASVSAAQAPQVAEDDGAELEDEADEAAARAEVKRFFSQPPAPPVPKAEPWRDLPPVANKEPAQQRSVQHGQLSTLIIFAIGVLSIGGYLLYERVLMPTAEPLPRAAVTLPTPEMMRDVPVLVEPVQPIPPAAPAQPKQNAGPTAAPAGEKQPAAAPTPASVAASEGITESDAEGYKTLLARARKQGLRRSAESSYLQALALRPRGAEALSGLAMLYLNQGKNGAARDRAREALAADDKSSEAWIVLGAALSGLGEERAAREAYASCAELPGDKYVAECRRMLR